MKHELLRLEHISISFSGTKVLDNVKLTLFEGELLALTGLNGSGKTVLSQIISGMIPTDKGVFFYEDTMIPGFSQFSDKSKIFYISNVSKLIPGMTVLENIFVINNRKKQVFVKEKEFRERTEKILTLFDIEISPDKEIDLLTEEQQHLIQICTAWEMGVRIIILDSITGAYDQIAMAKMIKTIRILLKNNISVIYVNNRLDAVFRYANRIMILEDGRNLRTVTREEYSKKRILDLLSNHEFTEEQIVRNIESEEECLKVRNLTCWDIFKGLDFTLHKGEILGLAINDGLVRKYLAEALFGISPDVNGEIYIEKTLVDIKKPQECHKQRNWLYQRIFLQQRFI